ncbi:hypothetical protein C8Q77DRAFT_169458 [Trametes polyzona]|nr:hypothetical protein C8Q77DRAFT_169458 [Trametes polyzona]
MNLIYLITTTIDGGASPRVLPVVLFLEVFYNTFTTMIVTDFLFGLQHAALAYPASLGESTGAGCSGQHERGGEPSVVEFARADVDAWDLELELRGVDAEEVSGGRAEGTSLGEQEEEEGVDEAREMEVLGSEADRGVGADEEGIMGAVTVSSRIGM